MEISAWSSCWSDAVEIPAWSCADVLLEYLLMSHILEPRGTSSSGGLTAGKGATVRCPHPRAKEAQMDDAVMEFLGTTATCKYWRSQHSLPDQPYPEGERSHLATSLSSTQFRKKAGHSGTRGSYLGTIYYNKLEALHLNKLFIKTEPKYRNKGQTKPEAPLPGELFPSREM